MNIRRLLCVFHGHDYVQDIRYAPPKKVFVRLKCFRCAMKTKWFDVWEAKPSNEWMNKTSEDKNMNDHHQPNQPWGQPFQSIDLTFKKFHEVNQKRSDLWMNKNSPWTLGDWGNALAGETGELCNVLKKIRRIECSMKQNPKYTKEKLREQAKEEIGGIYAYLDLVASELDLDIEDCVRNTFNDVSQREGFDERV